jgi:hypothetical protein
MRELFATILLPNSVANEDTERHVADRSFKFRRQINTGWGVRLLGMTAPTEFQDRCLKLLGHPSVTLLQYTLVQWSKLFALASG